MRQTVTPGAKFGKPAGVYGYLSDERLHELWLDHQRGESIRALGRRVWREAGYSSEASAANAICDQFKRLHLPARQRSLATAESNRVRHSNLPICGFQKANGLVCRRRTSKGRCWHHRPENLEPRLAALHAQTNGGRAPRRYPRLSTEASGLFWDMSEFTPDTGAVLYPDHPEVDDPDDP